MNTFMIDGEVVHVLDLDTNSGTPLIRRSTPSLTKRAKEELKECTPKDMESRFLTIYFESGLTWHTTDPEDTLRLSLVGQSYICSQWKKRMIPANALIVYYRPDERFVPLYEVHQFETKKNYPFLSRETLTKELLKVFKSVELTLGQLSSPGLNSIAWKAETNEGDFYVLWHNGCIVPAQSHFSFEPKPLSEMRYVYSILRFTTNQLELGECYNILCC